MLFSLCYSMKFNGCNRNHDLYKLSSEPSIHIHKYWMGNESVERTQLNSSPPKKQYMLRYAVAVHDEWNINQSSRKWKNNVIYVLNIE